MDRAYLLTHFHTLPTGIPGCRSLPAESTTQHATVARKKYARGLEIVIDMVYALPMSKDAIRPLFLKVGLSARERERLNAVCGPGRRIKREAWVREALIAALDREEASR